MNSKVNGNPISLMIIDRDFRFASSLTKQAELELDMGVFSHFLASGTALAHIAADQLEKVSDVVLIGDLQLDPNGSEWKSLLKVMSARSKVIVLVRENVHSEIVTAVDCGATGYLLKTDLNSVILNAVRNVHNGYSSINLQAAKMLFESRRPRQAGNIKVSLSQREIEVLMYLARGLNKKDIARALEIGYASVDTYSRRLYSKLEVSNAASAVNRAHNLNLFQDVPKRAA